MGATSPFTGITGGVPAAASGITRYISTAMPYIFGAAALLLLIYLVIGGLQLMTSRGDPKAIQGAQGKITAALIGFTIIMLAGVIVLLLGKLLNITIFNGLII